MTYDPRRLGMKWRWHLHRFWDDVMKVIWGRK